MSCNNQPKDYYELGLEYYFKKIKSEIDTIVLNNNICIVPIELVNREIYQTGYIAYDLRIDDVDIIYEPTVKQLINLTNNEQPSYTFCDLIDDFNHLKDPCRFNDKLCLIISPLYKKKRENC